VTHLRFSHLKHMGASPAHYRASLTASYDTPAMRLGRLVHLITLTPDRTVPVYEGTRRGRDWESFKERHVHEETVYTSSEFDAAVAIKEAVHHDPFAARLLLEPGLREHRIEWTRAGRPCAGTPDHFNATTLIDLKTCASADPRRWQGRFGEIHKRSYHAQLAWYADGIEAAGMPKPREAYLIAVETRAPFPVVVYRIEESELDAGRRQYSAWFEALRVCEEANHWPGYVQNVVSVEAEEDDESTELIFGDEEEEQAA
jgi:hypothetical protein